MAGKNIYSENDPLDINELASLEQDITDDFIENLQNNITKSIKKNDSGVAETKETAGTPPPINNEINAASKTSNDGDLFEEVNNAEEDNKTSTGFNSEIDDNFIKKYKAKLKRQQDSSENELDMPEHSGQAEESEDEDMSLKAKSLEQEPEQPTEPPAPEEHKDNIEALTGGNIVEKPVTQEALNYNDSLDYLDGNIKYSKYVVYVVPENVDFVESLTVKERKNLINRILREQDSIAITKRKYGKIQSIIWHIIISILTIAISIPCIYWIINASLEATINNYRSSQNAFEQLYKDHGKIKVK